MVSFSEKFHSLDTISLAEHAAKGKGEAKAENPDFGVANLLVASYTDHSGVNREQKDGQIGAQGANDDLFTKMS